MFKDFLKWAFALTADGCSKECVFIFKMNAIEAVIDKSISWVEFVGLMNIVNYKITLTPVC